MSDVYAAITVNPFEDNAVREPRAVTFSVPGLNDKPLEALVNKFDRLTEGRLPRHPAVADKAQLVVSPEPGYGKSHLLGRLFERLGERATKIYLRPFQAPERAWNSILLTTVQELDRHSPYGKQELTQLEAFAMGVLAHVAADFMMATGLTDDPKVKEAVDYLREHPLDILGPGRPNEALIDWLKARLDDPADLSKLGNFLRQRKVDVNGREKAWLKVLAGYVFTDAGSRERDASMAWLRGERLEDEDAYCLKLRTADNDGACDASPLEINHLSLQRLHALCALSSYYRPFLFCFDQTEFYGSEKALARALGSCIEELHAAVPNHLTIITTNATNWTEDIRPNMDSPCQHRFAAEIGLDGINSEQARILVAKRLKDFHLDDTIVSDFIEPRWLSSLFANRPQIGVRHLLMRAAERFRALAQPTSRPQPKLSMDQVFAVEENKVRAKEALHQYNQDCLMWFAQVLIQGYDAATVVKTKSKYFTVQWDWPDRLTCFAFEGGDHHLRWAAIADEAVRLAGSTTKKVTTIVFRTLDLKSIPRPTWQAAARRIEDARRKGLWIVPLDLDAVCELHAAREFYSDALQGNVEYAPEEVLKWLKSRFKAWFEKYSHPGTAEGGAPSGPPPADNPRSSSSATETSQAPAELTPAELETVVRHVRTRKLVDIKEVLTRLGRDTLKDALLRAVERSPNLKAHECVQTIYLQWRITA
jgi:hypothetical protein